MQPLVLGAAAAAETWREALEGLRAAQRSSAVGSVLMILQQDKRDVIVLAVEAN